jgi:hypothetical protein
MKTDGQEKKVMDSTSKELCKKGKSANTSENHTEDIGHQVKETVRGSGLEHRRGRRNDTSRDCRTINKTRE